MGFSKTFKVSDSSSSFEKQAKHVNEKGMSWFKACIFIVADMMGAGMVALPVAVGHTGLIPGAILLTLGAVFSCFTGIQLSKNWTIMQQRWEEYRDHCRRPYPEMAYRALGTKAKYAMDVCLAITLYGVVTVFTLLSATNIKMLVEGIFGVQLDFCLIILIVAFLVWPFMLLKSPMHFWQAAVISAVASSIAAGLVVYGIVQDLPVCQPHSQYPAFSYPGLFLGYGTMVFSYGGHSAFPTIQHDMKRPAQFTRSIYVSYAFILMIYLVVSILGIEVYGSSIRGSIIPSIQTKWIALVVNILITMHVLPAIIIVYSPLAQQIEEWTNAPHEFGIKRVVLRTSVFSLCIFTAMSVPKFGLILDLVGGSTTTLMTMLLPSIFWLYLNASNKLQLKTGDRLPTFSEIVEHTPRWVLVLNIVSLLFGLGGGIASTTTAVTELFSANMDPPCYMNWFRPTDHNETNILGITHCCGPNYNITVSGVPPEGFCVMP